MPALHVPQALGCVSKRVCAVRDRDELAVIDQRGDGDQFSPILPGGQEQKALADKPIDHGCPRDRAEGSEHVPRRATAVEHEDSGGGQCPAQLGQRPVAPVVKDHVVAGGLNGEVVGCVVDGVCSAERAHQFDVARAAHAGDLGAKGRRDLDRIAADAAGGAVDKHPESGPRLAHFPDSAQRRRGRYGDPRRLLERQAGRNVSGGLNRSCTIAFILHVLPLRHGRQCVDSAERDPKFIDQIFTNVNTDDFEGTLVVRVIGGQAAATALELGSLPGQFTTLPVTALNPP